MSSRIVGTMATGAVATGSQLAFSISKQSTAPAVWVLGLAGVEKAYLWMTVHAATPVWRQVYINGAAVEFTVSQEHVTLLSDGDYGLTKDATVGALEVVLEGL